jgi:hypothetical protein
MIATLAGLTFSEAPSPLPGVGVLLFGLLLYAYFAFCLMKIAEKTNTDNGWWAWIPILNVFLLLKIADKPMWWFILCLVPLVNIIIAILVWVGICAARGKSALLVVGMLIPGVNLFVLGYLAFSD